MSQMYIARELWAFMRERKKFWMLPMLLVLVVIGGVLIFAQGSVLAPFLYTIF
jgi:competence protein ComGC